jgi:hypothetical protein
MSPNDREVSHRQEVAWAAQRKWQHHRQMAPVLLSHMVIIFGFLAVVMDNKQCRNERQGHTNTQK